MENFGKMRATEGMPYLTKTITTYINIAYYFLLSPFKITYDTSANIITGTKCNGIHKVIYIFISAVPQVVIVYYNVLSKFIGIEEMPLVDPNINNIDKTMLTMRYCCWFCKNAVIKFELWYAAAQASKMIDKFMAIERRLNIQSKHFWIKHPRVTVFLIYAFMTSTSLTEALSGFFSSLHEPWSVKSCLICVSDHYENQVSHFGTKLLIVLSGIFFSCAHTLKEHVKTIGDHKEASYVLRLMLEASLSIKKCFGVTIVAACLTLLPYYASRVKDLFGNSLPDQYLYFNFMMSLILLLYLGAEANSQLNSSLSPFVLKMKGYSASTISNIHSRQTELIRRRNLLLLDVISEGVGLRGRCMTLNYTVFANMMASILAYSISIAQFQISGKTSNA